MCVECVTNEQCPRYMPVCDTEIYRCTIGCEDDEDCLYLGVCDPDTGTCVECYLDEHCEYYNQVCDLSEKACVDCVTDEDCETGVCDSGINECVECLRDGDCPDGTCDLETRTCIPEQGRPLCAECTSDLQCGGVEDLCLTMWVGTQQIDSGCGKYCEGDQDCPSGYSCIRTAARGYQCWPSYESDVNTCWAYRDLGKQCGDDAECGNPDYADAYCVGIPGTDYQYCTVGCSEDYQCPEGYRCVLGYCFSLP
jgi:Cys-rich repeat protein